VVDALRAHLTHLEELAASTPGWQDYGLVFPGDGGQPIRASVVYRRLKKIQAKNDLPDIRWHDLRHSAISIMLALGVSLHTVQKVVGQSSLEMMSRRYGHLIPEIAADELARLDILAA
jgi:integrase